MDFFCYEAYTFCVFQEGYAWRFAFALTKPHADMVKYLFVLRAQRRKPRRHREPATPRYNRKRNRRKPRIRTRTIQQHEGGIRRGKRLLARANTDHKSSFNFRKRMVTANQSFPDWFLFIYLKENVHPPALF